MIISLSQLLILSLVGVTLGLFIWGRWRHDVVALASLLTATLLGLVKPAEAFSGFGHPATITVTFILILSYGLAKSGVTNILAQSIQPASRWPSLQIALIIGIGAILSAFMNNVGVLALLMPVAIQSAINGNYSPSLILMPLSFGTILGGLVTMIGTPPNIVMATYRQSILGKPYNMFDFTPVGITVATVGVIFLAFIGWRFLGKREVVAKGAEDLFQIQSYITELKIKEGSRLIRKTIAEIEEMTKDLDLVLVGLVRSGRKHNTPSKNETIQKDDILIIEASPKDTELFVMRNQVEVGHGDTNTDIFKPSQDDWIEAVVTLRSAIEGRVVEQLSFGRRYGVRLLAVSREGTPFRGRLKSFRFKVGDVLLLRGEPEALKEFISSFRLLPLFQRGLELGKQQQPFLAISIFASAIILTTLGVLPFQISFGLAVLAMAITGIVPIRQLYDGIDWSVIVLIASLIPIGMAFETTGATNILSSAFLWLTQGANPVIVLTLLLIMTMGLTDILNNVTVVVLMAPFAKQLSDALGANPDTFLMTVTIGASCAFLTPIGHQNNAIIMGPGKYKFSDYWKIGLPLEIVILIVAIPTILKFWPL